MRFNNPIAQWMGSFAALAAVSASPGTAGPVEGKIGATSRAVVAIRLSTAPRAGLQWHNNGAVDEREESSGALCAWSTTGGRRLRLTVREAARPERKLLEHELPEAPKATCGRSAALDEHVRRLRRERTPGGYLLILAVE